MNFVIHAPNVHQGGGKTLLIELLCSHDQGSGLVCTLLADSRLDLAKVPEEVQVYTFPPTLRGRFAAERRLRSLSLGGNVVICMGNLPPLLKCPGRVVVFVQNRYLLDVHSLEGMPLKVRLRIHLERLWLRSKLKPDMELVVQTASMQSAAKQALGREAKVMPFSAFEKVERLPGPNNVPMLMYPATADKHKNHKNLLAAWKLLFASQTKVELHLTIDGNQEILDAISQLQRQGVPVVNHGQIAQDELKALYARCSAIIFPSFFESFGLPLLEAKASGIPVIASERDYVRDVIVPVETFDPDSPISIARAVQRFLDVSEQLLEPMPPSQFLRALVGRGEVSSSYT